MRETRSAVGEMVRLYVDANGAYAAEQALDYTRAMADAGATMVEDPCALIADARFRKLQQDGPVPLLLDFGCTSLRDAAFYIERDATALSAKPDDLDFRTRAMEKLARRAGCSLAVGLMGESMLGTLAGLQFASAVSHPVLPGELTWFLAITEQIATVTLKIVDRDIDLPECASLSALIDWRALQQLTT